MEDGKACRGLCSLLHDHGDGPCEAALRGAFVGWGELHFASAWPRGRVKLDASFKDLLTLRKLL
jgi:hypothetical protein